jgi:hypothetical protein
MDASSADLRSEQNPEAGLEFPDGERQEGMELREELTAERKEQGSEGRNPKGVTGMK